jgi:hypothetical protein
MRDILSFVEVAKNSRRAAEVMCLRQDSSVSIVKGYKLDHQGSFPGRVKILLSSTLSRVALDPTEPPIQWVPKALSYGIKLSTHLTASW